MLNHDEIQRLLPHKGEMVLIDVITELECSKKARGKYYLAVPEIKDERSDLRLSEVRALLVQSMLETAGVAVFCDSKFNGKLMDFLQINHLTYDIVFQEQVLNMEAYRIIELETEAELLAIKDKYAHAFGKVKHENTDIIKGKFYFWLLTPEELEESGGKLPEIED